MIRLPKASLPDCHQLNSKLWFPGGQNIGWRQLRLYAVMCVLFMIQIGIGHTAYARESDLETRRTRVLALAAPEAFKNQHPKFHGYEIVAASAVTGCSPDTRANYMARLPSTRGAATSEEPIEMFALPPLVRYLYQFGHCLSEEQKKDLLSAITGVKQRLTGHGTINHAAMRASSWYLLAQYFPQAKWTDWDGRIMTSRELQLQLKHLLSLRTWRFYQSGQTEWLSPTYTIVNLICVLNLIDFSDDPEVRHNAFDEATLQLSIVRLSSFRGTIVAPLTRRNADQRNAAGSGRNFVPAVGQHILWYYFGEPGSISDYDLRSLREPFFIGMLALSNWTPPVSIAELSPASGGLESIKITTPSFSNWGEANYDEVLADTVISEDFAIGTGNGTFDPNGANSNTQMFALLFKSVAPHNEVSCYHPYFQSDLGEDYWGNDRWSPFQQMHLYDRNKVLMLTQVPDLDPWPGSATNRLTATRSQHSRSPLKFLNCRIPKDVDEIVIEPKHIFIRAGAAFFGITAVLGDIKFSTLDNDIGDSYQVFRVLGARTVVHFQVDSVRDGFNFKGFQQLVHQTSVNVVGGRTSSNLKVEVESEDGEAISVQFNLRTDTVSGRVSAVPIVFKNGEPVVRMKQPVESRVMKLSGGILSLFGSGHQFLIDHAAPSIMPSVFPYRK